MKKFISFLIKIVQKNKFLGRLAEDLYSYIPYVFLRGKAFNPINVQLLLTYRCNLRCSMCYYYNESEQPHTLDVISKRKKEELTFEQITKLIDDLADMNVKVFTLHGGEPLVHADFFRISKYAVSKGLLVNFFTNGILLNEDTIDRIIDARINSLSISIDGPGGIHDKVRGMQGAFDKIMNGIAIFKRKEKEGITIPRIYIVSSVSAMNQDGIIGLFEKIKEHGIKEWSVGLVTNDSNNFSERTKKILGIPVERGQGDLTRLPVEITGLNIDKMLRIREELAKANAKASMQIVFPSVKAVEKINDPDFNESEFCLAPWARAIVSPYGEVHPCIMLSMVDADMGNIKERSFKEIWNGGKFVEFRKTLKKNRLLPICSKCCFINDKKSI